mmetsp:Transcript_15168/g.26932  ORF Transcript_15168/g.26932 Transcript_15168/m.26932 type:complete len:341 (+) Transcript_15168:102-1124(+)
MLSAVTGAVSGAVGDAVAKGKELTGLGGGVPGQEQLQALETSLKAAEAPITAMKTTLTAGVPGEAATKAQKSLTGFVDTMKDAQAGDVKKLIPGGCAALIASSWISSVKTKLGKLVDEVNSMAAKAGDVPTGLTAELKVLGEKADAISKGITDASQVPKDAVETIKGGMSKPAELPDVIGKIETAFKAAIKSVNDGLGDLETAITGILAKILSMVQEIVNDVQKFLMAAPKKVTKCFNPPAPCCCCCGTGEALQKMQDAFESAANAIDMAPVVKGVEALKESLDKVDLKPIRDTMAGAEKQMGEALAPAKEAAEKMGGSADKLRAVAGEAKDAAPAAPLS